MFQLYSRKCHTIVTLAASSRRMDLHIGPLSWNRTTVLNSPDVNVICFHISNGQSAFADSRSLYSNYIYATGIYKTYPYVTANRVIWPGQSKLARKRKPMNCYKMNSGGSSSFNSRGPGQASQNRGRADYYPSPHCSFVAILLGMYARLKILDYIILYI